MTLKEAGEKTNRTDESKLKLKNQKINELLDEVQTLNQRNQDLTEELKAITTELDVTIANIKMYS